MQELAKSYASIIEQLDSIVRIDITAAFLILEEIGSAPQEIFKTSARLCSWAGLSPRKTKAQAKLSPKRFYPEIRTSSLFCVRFLGQRFALEKHLLVCGFGRIKVN